MNRPPTLKLLHCTGHSSGEAALTPLTNAGASATLTRVKKRVVVVDNYDSFTYNLVQYVETLGGECDVRLNDRVTIDQIRQLKPSGVLLSPGPGNPDEAGITLSVIRELAGELPIFGVCLGHQAIGQAFGGKVVRAPELMHGKTSGIEHDGRSIFRGLPSPFEATRYHSLIVEEHGFPETLEISARTAKGEIMGLRHRKLAVEGVQFHPESILTDHGLRLIENWLGSL
jgi:anthranilate synthase/aminodeoxychorismate synthase-like glutamine amidotransferase